MGWISCKARDLVVGDAILVIRKVEIKLANGRYQQGSVRRKDEATGQWSEGQGRQKAEWKHTGRVLAVLANEGDPAVLVERIDDYPPDAAGAVRPLDVDRIPLRVLDWASAKLQRHTAHGPEQRTNPHGNYYLWMMLQEAAGGDENDDRAVTRLAACVRRGEIDAAEKNGTIPSQIGWPDARDMLAGKLLYSEAAVRQLTGRMTVRESQPNRDFGHHPTVPPKPIPPPTEAELEDAPGAGHQPADDVTPQEIDPEIAAILKALPGVSIREVRQVPQTVLDARREAEEAKAIQKGPSLIEGAAVLESEVPTDGPEEEIVYHTDEESDDSISVSGDLVIER